MRIVSRRTAPGTSEMVHASIEAGDVNPFSVRDDDARTENFDLRVPSMTAEAFEQLIVEVSAPITRSLVSANMLSQGKRSNGYRFPTRIRGQELLEQSLED